MTSVANSYKEIVAELYHSGLDSAAERIVYLRGLKEEDPEEPEMSLESLRQMTLFLCEEEAMGIPQLGLTWDGLLEAEWRLVEGGILAMDFLPSGLIRFAAISSPADSEGEIERVSGTLVKDGVMGAIAPFIKRISKP